MCDLHRGFGRLLYSAAASGGTAGGGGAKFLAQGVSSDSVDMESFLALTKELSNWGRWGKDDELGTVNFITPEKIREGAACVRSGRVFSLAVPFDHKGPQTRPGATPGQRFNAMLYMTRDGGDIETGAIEQMPAYAKQEHSRFTDDVWILPSQCGTQWDALAHCLHRNVMYNGFKASEVASWGARKCGIQILKDRIVTRGVLLDVARFLGQDSGQEWLPAGHAIHDADLEACARHQGVEVREGDVVLVRTGAMTQRRAEGAWGDYSGGDAPGLALSSTRWIHRKKIAAMAVDTWGAEVRPNEIAEVFQPFHIVGLVYMGLLLGEIFDLDALAADCASDKQYDFQFQAAPIPMTGAVGAPINPIAVK